MLVHIEGDSAHAGVSAASVALANLGQIDDRLFWSPGVRAHGNLHAEAALAESHAVNGFGMEIVRNELVIALEIVIGDVEKNGAVDTLGALLKDFDREFVTPQQRWQEWSHERFFQNGSQGFRGEKRNQVGDELVRRGLDDHSQLHSGSLHLDGGLGVGIESAIDHVSPMDEVGHGSGIEAKALLRDHGNKAGAGFEVWIVKLSIALIALEVDGVRGRKKRAQVMVKPPSDFGRTGVLEIDDGVFVAVEMRFIKQSSRAMQQAGEDEGGVLANALAIETGEESGGTSAVETLVVVEDSDFQ